MTRPFALGRYALAVALYVAAAIAWFAAYSPFTARDTTTCRAPGSGAHHRRPGA
jgi:hypothetical protein